MKPQYDEDFAQWSEETASALRARRFDEVDWERLAEEIESLGANERHALSSHLTRLVQHLLNWQYQSHRRPRGWRTTIVNQRVEIAKRLKVSPSLRRYLAAPYLAEDYADGRKLATAETGLPESAFPPECPYTAAQILDQEFLPE
jgi:hypothetical protein